MGKEDTDLVQAARRGAGPEAEQAFAVLVDRWKWPVFRFLRGKVRLHEDAEDLAAETFVQAWRSLPTLEDPSRFPSWVLGVAWRVLSSHYRDKGMSLEATPIDRAILEQEVLYAPPEARDDLRRAYAEMPPEDMAILRAKYEDNLTYDELAQKEGVSVSTIRDRLVSARDRLTRVLHRVGLLEEWRQAMESRRLRRGGRADGGVAGA